MKFFTKEKGVSIINSIKKSIWLKIYMRICTLIGIYVTFLIASSLFDEAKKLDLQLIKITEISEVTIQSAALPLPGSRVIESKISTLSKVDKLSNPFPDTKNVKISKSEYMSDYQLAFWLLKSCESLRPESYFDVNQNTNGWGTKAKFKGETISLKTANKRASEEFNRVYSNLGKRFPDLDRWTRLVLTVTDYNVGHFGEQMNKAIKTGNKKKIAKILKLYIHDANGKKLDGLVTRRNKEITLLLASEEEKQKIGKIIKAKVIKQTKENKID